MRTSPRNGATTPEPAAPTPSRRQYVYGLGFIAVALAVVVGTPAWLFVASRTCACAQPPDLAIDNRDAEPVTVTWSQTGVFGTSLLGRSESTRVEACAGATMTLPAGAVHLAIASASAVGAFDVEVPHTYSTGPIASFTVRDGGAVDRVWGPTDTGEVSCR